MTLKMKYFTLDEAERLLPDISESMSAAFETRAQIEQKVDHWRKVKDSLSDVDAAVLRGQIDYLASVLENQLGDITKHGAIPKDLNQGLVDFPARIGTKEGFYCWRMGETRIEHWHGLTDGFNGRKPIEREGTR